MKTLRLLFWLRWTLFLRSTNVSNRIGAILLPFMFALVLAPFYLGGAFLAFGGVYKMGSPVVIVALGACQLGWIYFGLLLGAMGRSFDLDRLLRYPLRPASVYAGNILASFVEPVCLMTLPTLLAVTIGAFMRSGLVAGVATLAAGVLVTLITAALLQLLLALLDELLRREWVRYVALSLFSLTFIGLQIGVQGVSRGLLERMTRTGVTAEDLIGYAASAVAAVPTAGWPAAVATGALDGSPWRVVLGFLGSLAVLGLLVAPGTALMRFTARAGESAGGGPARGGPAKGSFALAIPGLPAPVALLLTREIRYSLKSPQRLVSLILTPLVLVFLALTRGNRVMGQPAFAILLLGSTIATAAITQFAYDGPGVRSFFLLPCLPRDVLLAKNLEFLGRVALQLTLVFTPLALMTHAGWTSLGTAVLMGAAAVVFSCAALGTYVSIRWPVRARRRGMASRGDSGWGGFAMFLGTVAFAALVGATVWAARAIAGPAWAATAGVAAAAVHLAAAAVIWHLSLDRNATALLANRERLIEVIARVEEV
jgi:hypothetical protein